MGDTINCATVIVFSNICYIYLWGGFTVALKRNISTKGKKPP